MARCAFGPKKVARFRRETGLPVVSAMTRGGTDHRIDLCLDGGLMVHMMPDRSWWFDLSSRWGSRESPRFERVDLVGGPVAYHDNANAYAWEGRDEIRIPVHPLPLCHVYRKRDDGRFHYDGFTSYDE
jgi:hypothetical protein